jgi:hypothetical protein
MSEGEIQRFKNEKKPEILAEEIANYIREKSVGMLLDARKFNELITRFWAEKYRPVLSSGLWDRDVASKMRHAEGLALIKYIDLLTRDLTEWALNRNLMRLTKADVRLFMVSKNLKLSTTFEQMFYREAKLKYRYLPPWMRE